MRITAREFAALAIVAAGALFFPASTARAADEAPFDTLANLASALSESDAGEAIGYFDSHMKNYPDIEQRIDALVSHANISCAIDVVTDVESGGVHKLDLDWFMQLTNQTDSAQLERRRERVQVEMRLFKKRWKITGISPVGIFDPIHIQ